MDRRLWKADCLQSTDIHFLNTKYQSGAQRPASGAAREGDFVTSISCEGGTAGAKRPCWQIERSPRLFPLLSA